MQGSGDGRQINLEQKKKVGLGSFSEAMDMSYHIDFSPSSHRGYCISSWRIRVFWIELSVWGMRLWKLPNEIGVRLRMAKVGIIKYQIYLLYLQ